MVKKLQIVTTGKKSRRRRSASKRVNDGRAQWGAPNVQGDIPKERKLDQLSASCPRPRLTDIYTTRSFQVLTPISYATLNQFGAISFTLAALGNAANYTAMFDQYRIDYVKLELKPIANAIGLYALAANTFPPLYLVIDYDDSTTLTGTTAAQQYDNLMMLEAHESCSRAIQPRIAVAAYSGAFTSFANQMPQWIDCASSTVVHYGFKYVLPAATGAQTLLPSWDVYAEVVVSFQSVR